MSSVLDLESDYQKRSLRLAVIVHVFALGLLIFSFVFQSTGFKRDASAGKIMHAVTINAKVFHAMMAQPHSAPKKQKPIAHHRRVTRHKKIVPKPVVKQHTLKVYPKRRDFLRGAKERAAGVYTRYMRTASNDGNKVENSFAKGIKPVHHKKAVSLKPVKHKVVKKAVVHKTSSSSKTSGKKTSKTKVAKTVVKQKTSTPKINFSAEKKLLENQLSSEAAALSGAYNAKMKTEIDKYKALILNAIGQQWIMPEHFDKNLKTELLIHLASGGMVLNVDMLKSSGDAALDHSVINAVWKASPLPVPEDKTLFENFRALHLTVRPEGFYTYTLRD